MKIYYSNMGSIKSDKFPKIGILVSYYGLKKLPVLSYCNSLFLDSGAFSAWTQNKKIGVNDLMSFIRKNLNLIDVYCSLDNIISYEESVNNYKIMKSENLDPLPCFHYGEPFWVLEKYLEGTNYIALGGVAKKRKKERIKWLHQIFAKYKGIDFHGFGIQDREILLGYPWKSVDSSSAHVLARFGGICTPWGDYKINPEVNYKDLKWITPLKENKIKNWVTSLGIDYQKAKENTSEGTETRSLINIMYYEELSKSDTKLFKLNNVEGFGL